MPEFEIDTDDIVQLFVAVPLAVIVIIILLSVITSVGVGGEGSAAINATTEGYTTVDASVDELPSTVTVRATTGNALDFDGNTTVSANVSDGLGNDSWTVCAAVELDDQADLNGTYDVLAYDNASILLQFDAGNWSVYHDNGTHDGKATIAASDPKTTGSGSFLSFLFDSGEDELRRVCGRYNGTNNELDITRDGTRSPAVPLTASTTTRNVSVSWEGRQDEVRVFRSAVANATLTAYGEDPVQPLPGTAREARFMFDEGSGGLTTVYFADQTASVGTATWATGAGGPDLSEGMDYELAGSPFRLTIVSGGYLEGAPVEHVTWSGGALPAWLQTALGPLLFAVVVFVLAREARDRL